VNKNLRIFYTGRPGVGKSTIISKIISILNNNNCRIEGFIAPEVRMGGKRIGFKIVDIATGEEGWLARAGYNGPRIGRYGVVIEEAARIGGAALRRAIQNKTITIIDEIGPMELVIPLIRKLIIEVLDTSNPIIGVIHRGLKNKDPEIYKKIVSTGQIITVTEENRDRLQEEAKLVAYRLCTWSSNKGR